MILCVFARSQTLTSRRLETARHQSDLAHTDIVVLRLVLYQFQPEEAFLTCSSALGNSYRNLTQPKELLVNNLYMAQ